MMKKLERTMWGYCRVEVCGAFPETVLNACAMQALELWDMKCEDDHTLRFCVYERDIPALEDIARRCMCDMSVLGTAGGSTRRRFLKNHVWLLVSLLVALGILAASSLFIWDIDVYGCDELSEGEVLRALSDCGVDCGAYWPALSVDMIRADMLTRLPELAWMTVNVSGSRAIVLVEERVKKPEIYIESAGADIVAARTGIIRRLSVLNGTPLVGTGQSVTAGETVISGTMESLSRDARYVRAQGGVTADTWYEFSAVCPAQMQEKTPRAGIRRRFALKFGKSRYNFYFSSGNTVDGCDKIIHNYNAGIRGLFALPVTLVVEELRPYRLSGTFPADTAAMGARLEARLEDGLRGVVLSSSVTEGDNGGLAVVTLRAACRENIAQVKENDPAE